MKHANLQLYMAYLTRVIWKEFNFLYIKRGVSSKSRAQKKKNISCVCVMLDQFTFNHLRNA